LPLRGVPPWSSEELHCGFGDRRGRCGTEGRHAGLLLEVVFPCPCTIRRSPARMESAPLASPGLPGLLSVWPVCAWRGPTEVAPTEPQASFSARQARVAFVRARRCCCNGGRRLVCFFRAWSSAPRHTYALGSPRRATTRCTRRVHSVLCPLASCPSILLAQACAIPKPKLWPSMCGGASSIK